MIMAISAIQAVEILRAAGEPTRLRVLALLSREELSVLELCRILGQSQPRVSRHLKLLAEAGLVERFPDGAWVFYRQAGAGPGRLLAATALSLIDPQDVQFQEDARRLAAVDSERAAEAQAYFARNAAAWNEIRKLYVAEDEVEAAILAIVGEERVDRFIDLGSGAGRMLTLLGPRAGRAIGLDLSQQMLNIARAQVIEAGVPAELRHGDIFDTGLPDAFADLVSVHQVLHYLADPGAAVTEAARLVAPGGLLLVVDFAPHTLEHLREAHQHRRLGFTGEEIARWMSAAGLGVEADVTLAPTQTPDGRDHLTVRIWGGRRAAQPQRNAA
jgi:DNA-binding transcriptional ArsR family regulator